jgi:hypothetical protein
MIAKLLLTLLIIALFHSALGRRHLNRHHMLNRRVLFTALDRNVKKVVYIPNPSGFTIPNIICPTILRFRQTTTGLNIQQTIGSMTKNIVTSYNSKTNSFQSTITPAAGALSQIPVAYDIPVNFAGSTLVANAIHGSGLKAGTCVYTLQ